jgi:hypothetical protein
MGRDSASIVLVEKRENQMLDIKADLWTTDATGICITTNGYVKPNGRAVMGRGCALEAKNKFPDIDYTLGRIIKQFGNHVYPLLANGTKTIYSFPVKHNWWEDADMDLIKRSCQELKQYAQGHKLILLPRPGCGNGRLRWEYVRPVIEGILPLNVATIYK